MKVGVLSDSHDHLTRLGEAVEILRVAGVELLLHAGDFISPFSVPLLAKAGCPVKAVFGNNDGERVGLTQRFAAIGAEVRERPFLYEHEGKRLLLLHEPFALDTLVGSSHYDLVVYGHTHQFDLRVPESGAILLNPGEVCGWVTGKASGAIVDLAARSVETFDLA